MCNACMRRSCLSHSGGKPACTLCYMDKFCCNYYASVKMVSFPGLDTPSLLTVHTAMTSTVQKSVGMVHIHDACMKHSQLGLARPMYISGVYSVFLAGKSSNIRSYMCIYIRWLPLQSSNTQSYTCIYTVLVIPTIIKCTVIYVYIYGFG